MTAADVLRDAAARLAEAGIESPRREARLLWEHAQGRSERGAFESLLARRLAREPLAYIVGHKEFWSLDFAVGPGALVPRPETETLIEQALSAFPDRTAPLRILDLGTGSGCLLVTALTLYPKARGVGVDISGQALAWARENAGRHGVGDRVAFLLGGWEAAEGQFDLVLSNPPYVAEAEMAGLAPELGYEPRNALAAGPEGLETYRALGPAIAALLAPQGRAFLEIGAGQAEAAGAALTAGGLEIAGVAPDLSGVPRCLMARQGRRP
ncbi:MAG: peptide chain release factor N(5)-glutamine methyltransferase [Gammaproteobacteria bacterium]|nr:peptide chain release factor N(5)-glutamine methyltransferase [Gammaproteobacteria bacterium]